MPMVNGNSGIIGGKKMILHDMGTMPKEDEVQPVTPSGKKEKYYPTTYLSSKKLPGIEDYDIGDACKIVSVNKVVGKREKEAGEVEVEVEIRQSGIMDEKVSEEDYKDMSEEEKDKADEKEVLGEDGK